MTTSCASVLTYGRSKPTDLTFLNEFIRDLSDVLENGLQDNGCLFNITLKYIVCDALQQEHLSKVLNCAQVILDVTNVHKQVSGAEE